jgi:hypothetical protein
VVISQSNQATNYIVIEDTSSTSLAKIGILFFGIAVSVFSVWAIFVPERLRKLISAITDRALGYYVAAAVRLLLGITLIIAAPDSRFPVIFEIIGWLTIVAAVILLLIGQEQQRKLAVWFDRFPEMAIRSWLVLGVAFGAFLACGVL